MVAIGRIEISNQRTGIQQGPRHHLTKSSKYLGFVERSVGPSASSKIRSLARSCAVTRFGLFSAAVASGAGLSTTARNPSSMRSLSFFPRIAASALARRNSSSGRSTVVRIEAYKHKSDLMQCLPCRVEDLTHYRRTVDLARVGVNPAVVHRQFGDTVELFLLDPDIAQPGRQAEIGDQSGDDVGGRRAPLSERDDTH